MLLPEQAKSKFRVLLSLLICLAFWPLVAAVLGTLLAALGVKGLEIILIALGLIWLGLLVAVIVACSKTAADAGVTPWAALWLLLPAVGPFLVGMLFLEPLKYTADDKPAEARLPSTWGLIKHSWTFAFGTMRDNVKTSIWFLYTALLTGASAALTALWMPFSIIHLFIVIAAAFVTIWAAMKLYLEIAAREAGGPPTGAESATAKNSIGGYIWVALLSAFVTLGPMLAAILVYMVLALAVGAGVSAAKGGSSPTAGLLYALAHAGWPVVVALVVLLVLLAASTVWAVYKGTQLAFVMQAFILDGKPGFDALNQSSRIVKRRWWGTLWKNLLFGMTVGMGMTLAIQLMASALIALATALVKSNLYSQALAVFLASAAQGGVQILAMPLIISFSVKLYRAFKRTAV